MQAAAGGATEGACTTQVQDVTVEQYQSTTAYGAADALHDRYDTDADSVYDAAKDYVTEEIDAYENHGDKRAMETGKTDVEVEKPEQLEVEVEGQPKDRGIEEERTNGENEAQEEIEVGHEKETQERERENRTSNRPNW